FFQAEDGIRDKLVTGVQTCALPIYAQPVHQPDVILASRGVAPQDVGLAVAVEVTDPLHLPGLVAQRVDRTRPGDRETVHQPDVVLAGRSIAPQDVGLAIAVEVADPLHLPARGRIHEVDGTLGGDAQPVHQPAVILARRGVAPQNVGLAVAVEVATPLHLPGLTAP